MDKREYLAAYERILFWGRLSKGCASVALVLVGLRVAWQRGRITPYDGIVALLCVVTLLLNHFDRPPPQWPEGLL